MPDPITGTIGATIGSSLIGADAAGDAADTQAAAADRSTALQKAMFDKQIELQAPFRETGLAANNRLAHLLGIGRDPSVSTDGMTYEQLLQMADLDHRQKYGIGIDEIDPEVAQRWKDQMRASAAAGQSSGVAPQSGGDFGSLTRRFTRADFEADPGYQFRMDEGMRGLEGSAAARGGLLSGAAMKAIQKYGQGVASQEYGNAYNRFTSDQTNQYNRLAGLVNTGMGATNQIGNAAANYANNAGANIIGAGNAAASGIVGGANAIMGGINQGINSWQQNQLMNLVRSPSTGTSSTMSNNDLWNSWMGN